MKKTVKRIFASCIAFISIALWGITTVYAEKKADTRISTIKADVTGANIRIEKSDCDTIQTEYYGTASRAIYALKTAAKGTTYQISLKYKGKGIAPAIKEGGVIVKIPDGICPAVKIQGADGAGIVLDGVKADAELVTEHCAVEIINKHKSNQIRINSDADAYDICSVPIAGDFYLEADGSVVEYAFTKKPSNLKLRLAGGYVELPEGWSRKQTIGSGSPKMTVDMDGGIFELAVGSK